MKHIILIITAITLLGSSLTAQETAAADFMAKGLYEENINGDYRKAGEYYQKIIDEFGGVKKIAAQATFRLGRCLENSGSLEEANEKYMNLIELYPDQTELVSKARAELTNSEGIKYFTDVRDGRHYKYVSIGKFDWMAENLAYMPMVSPLEEQGGIWVYEYNGNDIEEAKLNPNFIIHGCLYDWKTANNVCPEGWYLPKNTEWLEMEKKMGLLEKPSNMEGHGLENKIFHKFRNHKDWPSSMENNISQLSLLPSGKRSATGSRNFFYGNGRTLGLWTSSTDTLDSPWERRYENDILPLLGRPHDGLSVRCIRASNRYKKDTIPPKLRLFGPEKGSTVSGNVAIEFSVVDDYQLKKIELFVKHNNSKEKIDSIFSTIGEPWFAFDWPSMKYPDGNYTISLVATDENNNMSFAETTIETLNQGIREKFDGTFIDERDQQVYKKINIGSQTWMAENLNFAINEGAGSWCFNELKVNCNEFGRLYNISSAFIACPAGWHLPSDLEWKILEKHLGMEEEELEYDCARNSGDVAKKIKSVSGWGTSVDRETKEIIDNNGVNSSGFNAVPGGLITYNVFEYRYWHASFWTSTKFGKSRAWTRSLWIHGSPGIVRSYAGSEQEAHSIRCIKN